MQTAAVQRSTSEAGNLSCLIKYTEDERRAILKVCIVYLCGWQEHQLLLFAYIYHPKSSSSVSRHLLIFIQNDALSITQLSERRMATTGVVQQVSLTVTASYLRNLLRFRFMSPANITLVLKQQCLVKKNLGRAVPYKASFNDL